MELAQRHALLQYDISLFVADLQTNNWIRLVPVDQDRAEVGVEVLQADAMRIDLVCKPDSGLGHVSARRVEAAAGDVEQRVADSLRVARQNP